MYEYIDGPEKLGTEDDLHHRICVISNIVPMMVKQAMYECDVELNDSEYNKRQWTSSYGYANYNTRDQIQ